MKKITHHITMFELNDTEIIVYECKLQKDILDHLDDMLDSVQYTNWETQFDGERFVIEYKDGSECAIDVFGIEGAYKKKNISRIIYDNACDTWVYGPYTVNEFGSVH